MIEREFPSRGDRQARQAARRKTIIIWSSVLVLLLALLLGVKPVYRGLKARRANQLAAEAEGMVRDGKFTEAASRYRAALQLDPLGYRPLAGAARLATRGGRPEARDIWLQVMRLPEVTSADRQDYANLLLQRGATGPAEKIIENLLRTAPDAKTMGLAAQYSDKTGHEEKAIQFARIRIERAPEDAAPRFQLAELLAKSSDAAKREEARQILWVVAGQEGPSRKASIEALARAPELSTREQQRVLVALEGFPDRSIIQDLLAAEIRLKIQSEATEQIYGEAIGRWGGGETGEVAELAHWLNEHGQSERVLTLLPTER
ncbi:MAG: hypothetical protein M3Q89_15045, partial [Verrucomicrobiota bacterium]|nr:hypothetical protein [Verrucomicrobiota bacterium]